MGSSEENKDARSVDLPFAALKRNEGHIKIVLLHVPKQAQEVRTFISSFVCIFPH